MTNLAMQALDRDDPRVVAWEAFKSTDEYENSVRWARNPVHIEGALWAAFVAGFERCSVFLGGPEPKAKASPTPRGEMARVDVVLASKGYQSSVHVDGRMLPCKGITVRMAGPDAELELVLVVDNRNVTYRDGKGAP